LEIQENNRFSNDFRRLLDGSKLLRAAKERKTFSIHFITFWIVCLAN